MRPPPATQPSKSQLPGGGGACVQRRTRDPTTKQRCQGANSARWCVPGSLLAPHLLRHPQPEPPLSPTSLAASSERDRQQCLRSGDYDVDASPPTTAENGFLGLCKRICLSVGAKLCRYRLWLALFIYFFAFFSLVFPPFPLRQNAGGRSVDN